MTDASDVTTADTNPKSLDAGPVLHKPLSEQTDAEIVARWDAQVQTKEERRQAQVQQKPRLTVGISFFIIERFRVCRLCGEKR